jgi:hypothetical protein
MEAHRPEPEESWQDRQFDEQHKQTLDLPIFDEYGQIVKCEDKTQDLCSLCKYDSFKGEHHACYVCAYGEMPEQCYYR